MTQTLHAGDKTKRKQFSNDILRYMEDENFLPRLIFRDKATFHISGTINRLNI